MTTVPNPMTLGPYPVRSLYAAALSQLDHAARAAHSGPGHKRLLSLPCTGRHPECDPATGLRRTVSTRAFRSAQPKTRSGGAQAPHPARQGTGAHLAPPPRAVSTWSTGPELTPVLRQAFPRWRDDMTCTHCALLLLNTALTEDMHHADTGVASADLTEGYAMPYMSREMNLKVSHDLVSAACRFVHVDQPATRRAGTDTSRLCADGRRVQGARNETHRRCPADHDQWGLVVSAGVTPC